MNEDQNGIIVRFIPTHVGNALVSVYPDVFYAGSSPRTWGTQDQNGIIVLDERFIPTHVGNANRSRKGISFQPVHPHARGERPG